MSIDDDEQDAPIIDDEEDAPASEACPQADCTEDTPGGSDLNLRCLACGLATCGLEKTCNCGAALRYLPRKLVEGPRETTRVFRGHSLWWPPHKPGYGAGRRRLNFRCGNCDHEISALERTYRH